MSNLKKKKKIIFWCSGKHKKVNWTAIFQIQSSTLSNCPTTNPIHQVCDYNFFFFFSSFETDTFIYKRGLVIYNKFDINVIWQNIIKLSLASKISSKVWVWSNSLEAVVAVRTFYSSSFSFSLVTRSCQGPEAWPWFAWLYVFIIGPCQQCSAQLKCNVCYGSYCVLISTHPSCETVCLSLMHNYRKVETLWLCQHACGWNKNHLKGIKGNYAQLKLNSSRQCEAP